MSHKPFRGGKSFQQSVNSLVGELSDHVRIIPVCMGASRDSGKSERISQIHNQSPP
jgi:hypothetical protein